MYLRIGRTIVNRLAHFIRLTVVRIRGKPVHQLETEVPQEIGKSQRLQDLDRHKISVVETYTMDYP